MKDAYSQAKSERNKRIRARRKALDEAIRRYTADRKAAIANGTKLPNFADYNNQQEQR